MLGLKAVIIVPCGNSVEKNQAIRAQDAELIEHGHDFQESLEFAGHLANQRGYTVVESFHERLVRGIRNLRFGILSAVPMLDVVYVPIGLGSSICGMAAARNALDLSTEIVGVSPQNRRPPLSASGSASSLKHLRNLCIADGLACRKPNPEAMATIWDQVQRIVEVTEAEIAEAMGILLPTTHTTLPKAQGRLPLQPHLRRRTSSCGNRVGVILTGGNVDRKTYIDAINGVSQAARPA